MRAFTPLIRWGVPGAALAALLGVATLAPSSSTPVRAQEHFCGPMDVAFVIDNTGSMGGALANIQSELASILTTIETASGNDYRLSLVSFPNDNVVVHDNFAANNKVPVQADLLGLTIGGGANEPESSDESLNTVVNALPAAGRPQNIDFTPAFRAGATKIAILVTDARPGGFDDNFVAGVDDVHAHLIATQAAALGIKVSAVFVPSPGNASTHATTRPIMMDYASTTGGVFVETAPDGTGAGLGITNLIAACGSGDGPDLTVTKEPKPGQPAPVPGSVYSFLIHVKNVGNQATPPPPIDVMLRDDLSGIGTFVFWTSIKGGGVCSSSPPYVNCSRGRMAPGEEWIIEIRVRLPNVNCTTLVNRAVVDLYNRIKESNELNNSTSLPVPIAVGTCEI